MSINRSSHATILAAVIATALIWPAAADEMLVGTEVCTTDGNVRTCQIWVNTAHMDELLSRMEEDTTRAMAEIQSLIAASNQQPLPSHRPSPIPQQKQNVPSYDDEFAAMLRWMQQHDELTGR